MLLRRLWTRRSDIAFLIAWLSALGGLITLAVWADHRYFLPFDVRPTEWIQGLHRYPQLDTLFRYTNDAGNYEFIAAVLLCSFVWLLMRGLRFEALMMAGAGALHYVQLGLRFAIHRPFSLDNPPWWAYPQYDIRQWPGPDGFPSGHVFGEVAVYGLVFAYVPRVIAFRPLAWAVRLFCAAVIVLGGPARVYAGAHWPSDVIGSMLLAALYLGIAWRVDRHVVHIRAVTAEQDLVPAATTTPAAARTY
ncbi:MAG: phosphatase PAP2 family protein [Chloroflexi bacterium]|nr:phosphatase PAP2 family protein [Chloroflexota bacterium]